MDLDKINAMMDRFENSDMRELELEDGDFHLYLSKNNIKKESISNRAPQVSVSQTNTKQISEKVEEDLSEGKTVDAPLVGIVYLQAKPGQAPFVKVGDHVKKGQTICIVEAMKMMTEIKSDKDGIVTKINVENEDLVEVGQPLINLKED